MVTYRCTEKVRKRFRLEAHEPSESSTTVLGDWYANVLNHGPERHVVLVSEVTLLPLIVPARKAEFPQTVRNYLLDVLQHLGIPDEMIRAEVDAMDTHCVAKTANRQVVGVLNEYVMLATHYMPEVSRTVASLKLSGTPMGPIDLDSADQRTCDAFGIPRRRDRWWHPRLGGPHIS